MFSSGTEPKTLYELLIYSDVCMLHVKPDSTAQHNG